MSIDERIAGYSDKELANLRENVERLALSGSAKQKAEAERKARAPARKAPARKQKA